ncbi:lamin tail domain-containing protein [Patescibacteria group bacterium]|nr:lamin tail domain-containing protein [Patescibacteria group bacterium]
MKLGFFIFGMFLFPVLASVYPASAVASVVINEVAWMGTANSSSDEWIELYNDGGGDVNLDGWVLYAQDDTPTINLSGMIIAGSFFVLERTDDTSIPDISADLIYTGALLDGGEILILKNNNGNEIDKIDASEGWPAGNKTTKETMQKSGLGWVTAVGTPKAQNVSQQEEGEDSEEANDDENISTVLPTQYIPPEEWPKIKAYAGKDKTMIVGALGEFRGEGFGLGNEPLENARYLWNFGDGSTKEGQNVTHFYKYTGKYRVVLDVSSGGYSSLDIMEVTVVPNEVFISEIKTGPDSFIELENKSNREINISGWMFHLDFQKFIFPQNSFIKEKSFLVIPLSSAGFSIHQGKNIVELLYPGGFPADSFSYNGIISDGQSFSRSGEDSFITSETPGRKNEPPAVVSVQSKVAQTEYPKVQEYNQAKVVEIKDEETSLAGLGGEANIIATVGGSYVKSRKFFYILLSLGLIVVSSLGVFLIRRQREV